MSDDPTVPRSDLNDIRASNLDALWAQNAHHINEKMTLDRAATAVAAGLDPKDFVSQFPGSTNSTTTNNSGISAGGLLGVIAALVTSGALSGLACYVINGSKGASATSTLPTPTVVAPSALPSSSPASAQPTAASASADKYQFRIIPDEK